MYAFTFSDQCVCVYVYVKAQQTIQELFGRIRNIKEKAEHSEHMVRDHHTHLEGESCFVLKRGGKRHLISWYPLSLSPGEEDHQ